MRRPLIVALAMCAITLSFQPAPAAAKAASPLEAINALLAVRAKAERAHDRNAFAATIDPVASTPFRDAQLKKFDGLASLPVTKLSYQARTDLAGDLTPAIDPTTYGGATVFLPQTIRTLEFELDADRPGIDDMWFTYVERNNKWFIGGDSDATDLGLEPTVDLWDSGPVIAVKSSHVLLIAHADAADRARALSDITERALATLAERWTLKWPGHLVGFLPSSPDELTNLLQASVDVTKFVAFVSYAFDPDTLRATAPRLYVQDANLSKYTLDQQTETLVHEFTHAAGSGYSGVFTPAWVQEGAADWIAGNKANVARGSGAADHAPRDDQFGAGTQGEIVRAYKDSRSLIAALARVGGPQAPFAFFQTLGAQQVRPGGQAYVVDDSLAKAGVANLADLEARWRSGK